jgi:O-antigen/teichoic acid export membrane protein
VTDVPADKGNAASPPTPRASGEGSSRGGAAVRQGFVWNLANFVLSQGAGLAIFLLLSREVTPAMFGVFALAAVIVDLFANQGRWAAMDALIQRQDFSPQALSTAFWSLIAVGAGFAILFALGAEFAGRALGESAVADVLRPLSLTLLLAPAAAVMDGLIMRTLQFRAQALRNMAGTLVGGGAALAVAFSMAPEWALVVQRVVGLGVTVLVMFAFTRWLPTLAFDRASARGFLSRTGQLWLTMALATAHARVIEASVGVRAGAVALGLLRVSQRFEETLHGPITGPIQALWVPILSSLRKDREESWRLFLRLSQITALIALPAFVGLGLVAHDLVRLALDDRYLAAGDILFLLGMSGFLIPGGFFSNLVFAGLDRSDLSLKFSVATLTLVIPAVWLAAAHGPVWAIAASMTIMGLSGFIATGLQVRMLGGAPLAFLAALLPAYAAGTVMAVCVVGLASVLPIESPAARLACLAPAGAAVYLGWLMLFHRSQVRAAFGFVLAARGGAPAPFPQ